MNKFTNIDLNNKLEIFWKIDVWNSNYKNILNLRIKKMIEQITKLYLKLNSNEEIININSKTFNIEIKNNKTFIINKIIELKKKYINYIKTHAESIPEYQILIIQSKIEILKNVV